MCNKILATLDAALFDSYNCSDLETFATFFAEDVEFYHDQGGVTVGEEKLTNSIKNNICGKVTRELVTGMMQVYHMKGRGAVEMGVHRFHPLGHDDTESVGEGKFHSSVAIRLHCSSGPQTAASTSSFPTNIRRGLMCRAI